MVFGGASIAGLGEQILVVVEQQRREIGGRRIELAVDGERVDDGLEQHALAQRRHEIVERQREAVRHIALQRCDIVVRRGEIGTRSPQGSPSTASWAIESQGCS